MKYKALDELSEHHYYADQQGFMSCGRPKEKNRGEGMIPSLGYLAICLLLISGNAMAQKKPHVAAYTSKVEIDNSSVTVRRNIHPPHSVTPMHSHVPGLAVFLTNVRERSTAPDGSSREIVHKAGDVVWSGARTHKLENLSDEPIEIIEIELKHP